MLIKIKTVNIAFFFTYGYSLKTWEDSGTLERELKPLRFLSKEYGYKFTLVTYGDESDLNINNVNSEFDILPIYTFTKKSKSKFINYTKSFITPFRLKKRLSNVDAIHQHQLLGSWVVIILKWLLKKPLLIRTGYDMYQFSKFENKKRLIIYLYKYLTYFSLKKANLYTVTSFADQEFLHSEFGNIFTNILVRPNYVDLQDHGSVNKRPDNKFLCVGRLVEQKNFKLLINEFKNTAEQFELNIVGEGKLKNELKNFAELNNVNLNFLGSMNNKNLLEIYPNFKYFISPSLYEGNPKTVLEAMASGCIVLASNIKNHTEIITNENNGYIFDLDKPMLQKIVNELNNNLEQQKFISNNSISYISESNSLEILLMNMDKDYNNLFMS